MGDVAMTAPVLRAVRAEYPQIRMIVLTRGFYAPFFDGIDHLSVHNIDLAGEHYGVVGVFRLYRQIVRQYKIDQVIDLNDKLYSKLLRRYFLFSGIHSVKIDKGRAEKKALTRERRKVFQQLRTSIDRYADAFAKAGYPVAIDQCLHRVERPIPEFVGPKLGPWVGFAPFAQHAGKVLSYALTGQVFAEFALRYPQVKFFIFGGGESECLIAEEFERKYPNCRSVVGKVKLRQELDLIANLDVMVSMDSSAQHMSSLVGTPVVSIWGATHHYAGFLALGQSEQDVVAVEDLVCRPCSVYGHKPCLRGDYACLNNINVHDIVSKIEKHLGYV